MPTPPDKPAQPPAIEVDAVSYSYPAMGLRERGTEALDRVSMIVEPGARVGILGPNGGGKSTLIKLMLGLLKPRSGSIRVFGVTPRQARLSGLIGYLPQRIEAQRGWPLSVRQVVALPMSCRLKPWQRLGTEQSEDINRALEMVAMADHADRPVGALSGGQLQRTMIARAIAGGPRLLVLDEPMVGVDVAGQQRFAELINTLHTELGLTTVIVTHDLRAIAAVADRVACLARTLHFHDAPEGLTPQVLADVFAHDVAGVLGDVHVDAHLAEDCNDPSHTHTDHQQGGGCCGHDHHGRGS
ncbi:MAG: metal ABC transporter ATP-binding protein [Phycisphaerales bacterium]|nr:metal ABC transporter ATP-binding protein [Phycisphaerales bacterium]